MANDEAQQHTAPRDGAFDWGIRYDAALGVWVYLLPRDERAEAAEDAVSLREWFESLGTDAACGAIELPAKDRVGTLVYSPGWYAYTLEDPRVARQEAPDDTWDEDWEEEEDLRERRREVMYYLISEVASLNWRHNDADGVRWVQLDEILREMWSTYDDSWVYEDFDDSDDSDE